MWADHVPAFEAFLVVSGQWRMTGTGHVLGLDYTAVRAGFDLAGVSVTPDLWAEVQLIEAGARRALNGDEK